MITITVDYETHETDKKSKNCVTFYGEPLRGELVSQFCAMLQSVGYSFPDSYIQELEEF